jgi:hypothetical protein
MVWWGGGPSFAGSWSTFPEDSPPVCSKCADGTCAHPASAARCSCGGASNLSSSPAKKRRAYMCKEGRAEAAARRQHDPIPRQRGGEGGPGLGRPNGLARTRH